MRPGPFAQRARFGAVPLGPAAHPARGAEFFGGAWGGLEKQKPALAAERWNQVFHHVFFTRSFWFRSRRLETWALVPMTVVHVAWISLPIFLHPYADVALAKGPESTRFGARDNLQVSVVSVKGMFMCWLEPVALCHFLKQDASSMPTRKFVDDSCGATCANKWAVL